MAETAAIYTNAATKWGCKKTIKRKIEVCRTGEPRFFASKTSEPGKFVKKSK